MSQSFFIYVKKKKKKKSNITFVKNRRNSSLSFKDHERYTTSQDKKTNQKRNQTTLFKAKGNPSQHKATRGAYEGMYKG
jgi:nickel-dependent lactate racemase